MRKLWKILFVLPSRHRAGYLQLLILIFIFLLLKTFSGILYPPRPISFTQMNVDSLLLVMDNASIYEVEEDSFFLFDPNRATHSQFVRMGISTEVSNRIIKYRSRGGTFKEKSDLMKIYGFEEELFLKLAPFVNLPEELVDNLEIIKSNTDPKKEIEKILVEKEDSKFQEKEPLVRISLNEADSIALEELYGIGPSIAKGIVKYRKRLGGFVSYDQIFEVYNMTDERFEEIKKYYYIDENYEPRKMSINNDDFKTLLIHPYFDYSTVKNLFNYRDQHGEYDSIDDLRDLFFMTDSLFYKLKPYLSL